MQYATIKYFTTIVFLQRYNIKDRHSFPSFTNYKKPHTTVEIKNKFDPHWP